MTSGILWIGRHWLRLGIIAVFLFIINRKQIDLSIQLGSPQPTVQPEQPPAPEPVKDKAEVFTESSASRSSDQSWLQKMHVLSGSTYPELSQRLREVPEDRVRGFIRRFSHVAKKENEKFGIPASIILANALLQSIGGTSNAAKAGDNLFNLPCTSDWQGASVNDADHCYRKYDNAWTSIRDHSLYLTTGRFAALTQLPKHDYRRWAEGLAELGFNNTPELADQLIDTVEEWQLFQFD